MIKNSTSFSSGYTVAYSDASILKIAEIQSVIPLTKLSGLHMSVLQTITSEIPQLARDLPYYNTEYISKLKEFAQNFKSKFKNIVVVGMGGGILNGMCLHDFSSQNDINFIFSTKICASYLSKIKNTLDLKSTGFIFISNSGDTVETVISAEYWYGVLLNEQITDFSDRFIFIYGDKETSLLKDLHTTYGGQYFEYDSNMGGRFSTFTTPHLLIAAINGMVLDELFEDANNVLNDFKLNNKNFNQSLYSGAFFTMHSLNQHQNTTTLIGSYNSELYGLTKWYHTAIAETFGRENINISPINLDLPIDQHGLMQAVLKNNTKQNLNLFSIEDCTNPRINNVQRMLQSEIVEQFIEAGIPVREFIFNNRSVRTLGAVLMHLILETIIAGILVNENPFIQPQIDNIKKNIAKKYRQSIQHGVP